MSDNSEHIMADAAASASLEMNSAANEKGEVLGHYRAELWRDGEIVWAEEFDNLVTTVGKNDLLDKYLAGATYTANFVMGLKGTGTAVVGDTQTSHASWLEVGGANAPAYSGTRKVPAWAAASAGSKATSAAVAFTFTSGGSVFGAFLNSGGTTAQDNTTGVLFSAGDFSASRTVVSGDVLNVTYSLAV